MSGADWPAGQGPDRARIRPYLRTQPATSPPDRDPAGRDPAGRDPAIDNPAIDNPAGDNPAGDGHDPGNLPPARPDARTRPFVLTAGRVHAVDPQISLETQVTVRPVPLPWAPPVATLASELQAIIALCAEPISVAEISARVPLHLGVTKVLVGDLRAAGHLDVHSQDAVNPHDPDLIMRVIRGLRAIA